MYGRYHHNYADNELYWVAKGLHALWERPDLSHFHDHFTRTGQSQPAYWESVKRNDLPDCLLYYARVHEHFPGHEPIAGMREARSFDVTMLKDQMLALAEQRLFRVAIDNPYADAIGRTLLACRDAGQDPVAIYGFGLHTQVAGSALREPPVKVACIIDDNESNHGRVAWGIPVVSREAALRMGVRAVILSGNSVEDALWTNAAVFRERGIEVRRIYGSTQAGASVATTTQLVRA
jgi:hypothetical protein